MNAFVLNRHGRMVFPSNIMPELDFSTMESLEQLDSVIRRDFETKAPSGTEILEKVRTGAYETRYDLMRDLALNLFWANRFSITMYDKRPTRWADVPRTRSDVFLPVLRALGGRRGEGHRACRRPTRGCRRNGTRACEDRIFEILFDVFANRKHHATTLPAVKPTVAEFLEQPGNLTFRLPHYDPDFPVYDYTDILDCRRGRPRARGAAPLGDGAAQPVPVGPVAGRAGRGRPARGRRLRGRLPPAGQGGPGLPAPAARAGARATPRRRPAGVAAAGAAVPGDRRPAALLRAAAARVAGRGARRPGVQQRRPDPQHRLQLVADERRRDPRRRPASSSAGTARCRWRSSRCRRPRRRWPRPGASRRRSAACWSAPAPAPG